MKKIPVKKTITIINKPEFHQAIMRYVYLLDHKDEIDKIYKFYFCELYDLKPGFKTFTDNNFNEFKTKYFRVLKKYMNDPSQLETKSIGDIIIELKTKHNKKNQPVFASKLMHTVNPKKYYIWDSVVTNKKHYNVNYQYNYKNNDDNFDERYKEYINKKYKDYQNIVKEQISKNKKIINIFKKDKKYKHCKIENHKIIDFILWQDR